MKSHTRHNVKFSQRYQNSIAALLELLQQCLTDVVQGADKKKLGDEMRTVEKNTGTNKVLKSSARITCQFVCQFRGCACQCVCWNGGWWVMGEVLGGTYSVAVEW